jgi:hypothetical protein
MLKAPSATEDFLPVSSSSRPLVVARSGNGNSVCINQANTGFSWNCSSLGAPPGGVTTGPSITVMPKYNPGGTNIEFTFVFVRNGNNFYEKHLQDQGTGWTNWSTAMLQPPPGVTANSALVASHGNASIAVAFRDTNNTVWINEAPQDPFDGLPTFYPGNWHQAAKDGSGTTSAPSPAISDAYTTLVALGPGTNIRFTPQNGPPWLASWSDVPNFTQGFNEGVQTLTVTYFGMTSWIHMVATHTGNVYYDKLSIYDHPAVNLGSAILTSPTGKAADSAPAEALIFSNGAEGPLVVVHMNDGHYWTYDKNNNGPWQQMPGVP